MYPAWSVWPAVMRACTECICTLHGLCGLLSCVHVLSAYVPCMVCCHACMHRAPVRAAHSVHPAVMQQTLHTLESAHHLLTADQV